MFHFAPFATSSSNKSQHQRGEKIIPVIFWLFLFFQFQHSHFSLFLNFFSFLKNETLALKYWFGAVAANICHTLKPYYWCLNSRCGLDIKTTTHDLSRTLKYLRHEKNRSPEMQQIEAFEDKLEDRGQVLRRRCSDKDVAVPVCYRTGQAHPDRSRFSSPPWYIFFR